MGTKQAASVGDRRCGGWEARFPWQQCLVGGVQVRVGRRAGASSANRSRTKSKNIIVPCQFSAMDVIPGLEEFCAV